MRDGISIGMSGEPLGVRNLHAAENQFSAFGEWMRVVADADAHEESIITLKPDPPLRARVWRQHTERCHQAPETCRQHALTCHQPRRTCSQMFIMCPQSRTFEPQRCLRCL